MTMSCTHEKMSWQRIYLAKTDMRDISAIMVGWSWLFDPPNRQDHARVFPRFCGGYRNMCFLTEAMILLLCWLNVCVAGEAEVEQAARANRERRRLEAAAGLLLGGGLGRGHGYAIAYCNTLCRSWQCYYHNDIAIISLIIYYGCMCKNVKNTHAAYKKTTDRCIA